jgi:hypothetical protein
MNIDGLIICAYDQFIYEPDRGPTTRNLYMADNDDKKPIPVPVDLSSHSLAA